MRLGRCTSSPCSIRTCSSLAATPCATIHAAQHPAAGLTAFAQSQHAWAHGVASAFLIAAILDVASLLVILLVIRTKRPASAEAEPVALLEQEPVAS